MKRKFCITILMIMLVMVMIPQSAFAVITELDPATMQPIASENNSNESLTMVELYNGVYYNRTEGMYQYDLQTLYDDYVYSSVMDGMITTETVTFKATDGVRYAVNRNGEDLGQITEATSPGSYQVTAGDNNIKLFSFKIVNSVTTDIASYEMPTAFQVMGVTCNGEDLGYQGASSVSLTDEGEYSIKYSCTKTGITYYLDVTIDRTAPVLQLAAVVDGVAKGPVDISDIEAGCSIYIELDGEPISYSDTLDDVGTYYIVLADEAGNYTNYSFRINIYFDVKSWIFIALLLGAIVGVVVYIYISRKNLRVR